MSGIKHTDSGRATINKTRLAMMSKAVSIYEEKYFDMNVTHALEHLRTEGGLENLKYKILRQKLKMKGLIKKNDLQRKDINEFVHQQKVIFFRWMDLITSCLKSLFYFIN